MFSHILFRIQLVLFSFFLLPMLAAPVGAQTCSDCEISNQSVASANARLNLTDAQKRAAEDRHLPFGLHRAPANASNEFLLHQREWLTWYDGDLRVPLWVAYELTRADAVATRPRRNCFRQDPRLSAEFSATCEDYDRDPFDRGHIIPRSDLNRSLTAMANSFILSNMAPQFANFNRIGKVWEVLENKVRRWAISTGKIYVISGSVFDRDGDGRRDRDADAQRAGETRRVAVLSHFYKIIIHVRPNGFIDTISFLLPHDNVSESNPDAYLRSHIVSIDEIEAVTGIDFFPDIEDAREAATESFEAPGLWQVN
jgi:DNA/RNA endonuclease G (NUC1)